MTAIDRYDETSERFDRVRTNLQAAVHHLEDEASPLASSSYDPISRSNMKTVKLCKEHQVDLSDCRRAEFTCTVAIDVPVHPDPTGDHAVEEDVARTRLRELDDKLRSYDRLAKWFEDFCQDNQRRSPRTPNVVEQRKAEQENRKVTSCGVCARSGKHVDAVAVTTAGVYTEPLPLCSWHQRWALTHKRPPTDEEEATHQRGKNVTKRVMQMDRLRRGLLEGGLVS